MRIQFDYRWYDESKSAIYYSARDNWTWKDFHAVVHVSRFAIQNEANTVQTIIDFSTGHRDRFPSGIAAHSRTFGKKLVPNLSGHAVVIGVPQAALAQLGIAESKRLPTADGTVYFVDSMDEAAVILDTLA